VRFAILMHHGGWDDLPDDEQGRVIEQLGAFRRALEAKGRLVEVLHLGPVPAARTVRLSASGERRVEDGPACEPERTVGAIYLIDVDSEAEALEWADRGRFVPGANEVRALPA
jgi:hypothetical protein